MLRPLGLPSLMLFKKLILRLCCILIVIETNVEVQNSRERLDNPPAVPSKNLARK
jgi:hypothetical protein